MAISHDSPDSGSALNGAPRPKHSADPTGYMRAWRADQRADGKCCECSAAAEPGKSRCVHHAEKRAPGRRLDAVDVYDLAVERLGANAAVWSPGPGQHFIGRWVPSTILGRVLLRSKSKALLVLGEGASWEDAWAAVLEGVR